MINNMTFNQKKFFSLLLAVVIVALASMLTGCGKSEAEKAAGQLAAQQKAANEAVAIFMQQGSGTVRKWGQKPASEPAKGADDAKK
jgi:curli biogenesis system outer membrane secretion channel CsgG